MDLKSIIESLSPLERKIIPFLKESNIEKIIENSGLDRVSVLRALDFLNSKEAIILKINKKKIIDLGINGIFYKKKGLPERQLLYFLEKGPVKIQLAQKESKLTPNEFKAALGSLKKKALIGMEEGEIVFIGKREEIVKKSLEEQFLDKLPLELDELNSEEKNTKFKII